MWKSKKVTIKKPRSKDETSGDFDFDVAASEVMSPSRAKGGSEEAEGFCLYEGDPSVLKWVSVMAGAVLIVVMLIVGWIYVEQEKTMQECIKQGNAPDECALLDDVNGSKLKLRIEKTSKPKEK